MKRSGSREPESGEIAARLRRRMLEHMARMLDDLPQRAATEVKRPEGEETHLFKLRDLTAAYKDLTGGLDAGAGGDVEDLSFIDALLDGEDEE